MQTEDCRSKIEVHICLSTCLLLPLLLAACTPAPPPLSHSPPPAGIKPAPTTTPVPAGFTPARSRTPHPAQSPTVHELAVGYYGWRTGSLTKIQFYDGKIAPPDTFANSLPFTNAGTFALAHLFAQFHDSTAWEQELDPEQEFMALYTQIFGSPWERERTIYPPALQQRSRYPLNPASRRASAAGRTTPGTAAGRSPRWISPRRARQGLHTLRNLAAGRRRWAGHALRVGGSRAGFGRRRAGTSSTCTWPTRGAYQQALTWPRMTASAILRVRAAR